MADGTVTIKASFDGKDAESGVSRIKTALGGLGTAGQRLGSTFKSVLGANLVGTAITASLNAVSNSIKGVMSAAISEGAKLQQSFGGVDTLYSGAEKQVKSYAAEAYKAGVSANSYAEQAVSFGAALKQSLGGDAVKAAEAANTAIMDMTDNSAKMGTDLGVVQQTYQSLARGNFAMLDNLKLGFGGTRSEMERLLKTAEDLTGKKYDISNFADITEAIHAVQKNLGLTGTAAKEAKTTFSGSLGAMKSSFQNLAGALAASELNIKPALKNLAETTSTFLFGNFFPMVGRIFKQLPGAIGTFIEASKPQIAKGLSNMLKGINIDIKPNVIEKSITNIVSKISSFAGQVKEFFSNFANTGVFSSLAQAFDSVGGALGNLLAAVSGGKGDWTEFGTTLGNVIKTLADGATKIGDFIGKMDPSILQSWILTLGAIIGGFKIWKAVTGGNAITGFLDKITGGLFKSKNASTKFGSTIKSVFSGMAQLVKAGGTAISTAAKGIGTGFATAFTALGRAISMVPPTTFLALGAALIALGVSVYIVAQGFSVMADAAIRLSQAGTGAIVAFGIMVAGVVALVAVLGIFGAGLSAGAVGMLAFGAAAIMIGIAIAIVATQASGVSQIITALANGFATIATAIASAIATILSAIAPLLPGIAMIITAIAPIAMQFIQLFQTMVQQIAPIIDSISNLFQTLGQQISSILDSASGVITSFGNTVTSILNSVAGVFDSIGNAALHAGQGVKLMAQGLQILTNLPLGDLTGTLTVVASGLAGIANSGIATAGPGLQAAGIGMMLIGTAGTMAQAALTALPTVITMFTASLTTLPAQLTLAQTALMTFASGAIASLAGLATAGAMILAFGVQLTTIVASTATANAGLSAFNAQANMAGAALSRLGSFATTSSSQISMLGSTITSSMANASSAVSSAGTRMTTAMQSTMNQMNMAVRNGMNNIVSATRSGGSQMVSAFRASAQQLVTAAQSAVSQAVSAVRAGYGSMVSAGHYIGQGLAVGMRQALGEVTAAANELVAQAERAAQAKAKINSPSHLFRDEVGWWIGLGIAKGIDNSAPEVANSLDFIRGQVAGFNVRANNLLQGTTSRMSSQLKVETLRGKTPKVQASARQEAYIAHSASLLNDVIDGLAEVRDQVAQGQKMVLDTGALVGGTANTYDNAFGTLQTLKGRHKL
ncbi:hypothetical protein BOVMAS19_12840 [Streptococcus uberis]